MSRKYSVCSLFIISSFIAGLSTAVPRILAMQYKTYRITAACLQQSINKWMVPALFACFVLLISFYVLKLLDSKIIEFKINVKDNQKCTLLVVTLLCTAFFLCIGWAINHYYLINNYNVKGLTVNAIIFLFSIFLGWLLLQFKIDQVYRVLQTLNRVLDSAYIKTTSIIFISFFIVLNAGVFIDGKINSIPAYSEMDKKPPGNWHKIRTRNNNPIDEQTKEKLLALGYLGGYDPAPQLKNVTTYKKDLVYPGLNFYVSGNAPEAYLVDMTGNILHTWHYKNFRGINAQTFFKNENSYWRRAHLFKNGDILAIYEGNGLIKLDKDSNLLWSYSGEGKPHHDLEVTDDGYIYLLTYQDKELHSFYKERPWFKKISISSNNKAPESIREDFITILNHNGAVIKHISLIDLLVRSPFHVLVEAATANSSIYEALGDLFHTNTLEVFSGKQERISALFKKGNILVSFFTIDTIAIIDMQAEKIVWALGNGMWRAQHQPTLLDNGNMLIFDNWYIANSSRVLEFEPFSQKIVWEYKGQTDNPFYSMFCGSNQRLPNGNTLITETTYGRVFEVTKNNIIVWEFLNPHRAGENKELIATIPEMIRIEPDYCDFLAKK